MAEEMLSPEDASELKSILMKIVDGVEKTGMPRHLIGAGMVGTGAGIVAAHLGSERAQSVLQSALDTVLVDAGQVQ